MRRMIAGVGILFALQCGMSIHGAEKEKTPFISAQEQDYGKDNLAAGQLAMKSLQIPVEELNIRGGLPNFLAKAKAGKPVTVVYFGGSITAHNGWRPQSFEKMQKMFPQSKMTMVNASVGGTGSMVGVFRADKDLLPSNPDLVLIEFAVNDVGDVARRAKDVMRSLEGIILKLRKSKPDIDICLFYTMQTQDVETVRKGLAQSAAAAHEQVAAHYNLPSIHVGPAVVKAVDGGQAVFKGDVSDKATGKDSQGRLVITNDNTHPVIPTGHAFYAGVFERALQQIAESKPSPSASALPKPMFGTTWEKAKTIPVDGNAVFAGEWEKLTAKDGPSCMRFGKTFYNWFPFLYRTAQPGASVSVRFNGSIVGLKGVDGPDSGVVKVKVDAQPETSANHFSVYNTRSFYGGGPQPELPEGEHTVTFTLSDEKPDKGRILASYYVKDNDKDFKENPEKYAPTRFSVGEIMLIGEVVR